MHASPGFFITGTDTGVGKTLVSSALLHKFAQSGIKTLGMKPVAAGCELRDGNLVSEDVLQLIAASSAKAALSDINPYAFQPAIAPHIAAQLADVEIRFEHIQHAYARLDALADIVIVEGVGGFCVPLADEFDTADLAQRMHLPVILVVGMRLGCLNHALLTAYAIRQRGLRLAGWVANAVDFDMDAYEENLQALQLRLHAPCLGMLPTLDNGADFAAAAAYLELPI